MPKWSGDLKMAPAHPHATSVAVYPALFFSSRVVNIQQLAFAFWVDDVKHGFDVGIVEQYGTMLEKRFWIRG